MSYGNVSRKRGHKTPCHLKRVRRGQREEGDSSKVVPVISKSGSHNKKELTLFGTCGEKRKEVIEGGSRIFHRKDGRGGGTTGGPGKVLPSSAQEKAGEEHGKKKRVGVQKAWESTQLDLRRAHGEADKVLVPRPSKAPPLFWKNLYRRKGCERSLGGEKKSRTNDARRREKRDFQRFTIRDLSW